jgi:glycosyltransferase involved in cell wall biosynthesis
MKLNKTKQKLSISIIIPTLNAERVLERCLRSITIQDYPKGQVEIIIADGGSIDQTLKIGKKFGAKIYSNLLKTGEAGKALGIKQASNDLICLIDSDNILSEKNWLSQMTEPFEDPQIVGSEPLKFTYRPKDNYLTRYFALLGMNDPLVLFLGNYDRFSHLTNQWTEIKLKVQDQGKWLKIALDPDRLPTFGANGTLLRHDLVNKITGNNNYFFDLDIIYNLAKNKDQYFAKVKIGIVHLYAENIATFIRKQNRRLKDFLYYQQGGQRSYPWKKNPQKLAKFILYNLLVLPLFGQSIRGYLNKPDWAWFFHPIATEITFWTYGLGWIQAKFHPQITDRQNWGQ